MTNPTDKLAEALKLCPEFKAWWAENYATRDLDLSAKILAREAFIAGMELTYEAQKAAPDERLEKIKSFLRMRYGRNLSDVHEDMAFLVEKLEQQDAPEEVREAVEALTEHVKYAEETEQVFAVVDMRQVKTLITAALRASTDEKEIELEDVKVWADGIRGDLGTEYANRVTDEEAKISHAILASTDGVVVPREELKEIDDILENICSDVFSTKLEKDRMRKVVRARCVRIAAILEKHLPAPPKDGG